jgi:lipoprotein-anchoring transpeptidase ErfK/SrfK
MSRLALATVLAFALSTAATAQPRDFAQGVVLVPTAYPLTAGKSLYEMDLSQPAKPANEGFSRATLMDFPTPGKPGSIVIDTAANRLYFILGNGRAAMYPVASAKAGFEWSGTEKVTSKTTWPAWRPPVEMRKRRPDLPEFMAGGPKNPLGARAIYLGSSIYRIHGTNEPTSIGKPVSSGCIRMLNADVEELYRHVKIGAAVTVL